jgi:hypothetical protein
VVYGIRHNGDNTCGRRNADCANIKRQTVVSRRSTRAYGGISFLDHLLAPVLPHRHTTLWGIMALALIAIPDLRIIGRLVPEIFALPFWPQFADHIAFGAVLGGSFNTVGRSQ